MKDGQPHAGPQVPGQTKRQTEGNVTEGQTQRQRSDLMQDPKHMDRQRNRKGMKQRDRHRDRDRQTSCRQDPRHMDRQKREGDRNKGADTDRPHAGPKAYGQTEKETGTETEGQRQTSCKIQGTWTDRKRGDKNRGTDTGTDRQTSCRTQGTWTDKETEGE